MGPNVIKERTIFLFGTDVEATLCLTLRAAGLAENNAGVP